ncbi:oxidoreductase [Colletotrichum tamarilloi]|uniref:Oxidoreductase n=1 Tax=Colletotrichum tamarilloi TaxID=1209934 RepID=A0ABQ9QZD5_9PEZI|nr:oxidoreductase [Colletotrichum tamarilloi]KAK1490277.1 oxidoreductase [Colletotrichum tamarilloi]
MRSTVFTSILALAATMTMGSAVARAKKPPFFFLIGDSTVAVNGGWGDGFLSYLKDPAKGENRGKSGSTTVSWKSNGRWASLLQGINDTMADYEPVVTIQFGHNDQKSLTLDEFRANLVNIATELKDAGATPIFITSLTRRRFEDGEVVRDLAEWRGKTIAAAKASSVRWLDLNLASTDYVNAIGEENAQYYNLASTDRTHLGEAGEIVFGRMVVDLLLEKRSDLDVYFSADEEITDAIANGEFATGGKSQDHGTVTRGVHGRNMNLTLKWDILPVNSQQQFRGLSPVSDQIAWVSGTGGTVLRTTDGGASWQSVGPELSTEDADLQFRDVQAFSAEKAIILSIGEGADSRIYITKNGGESWTQSFANEEASAFFNCVDFEDDERGIAVSDPVDGKFRLIETLDGGNTWTIVDPSGMPSALEGEFGFAASGTCISTAAGRWYLASGGIDPGRIFQSANGYEWDVSSSAIAGGASAGVFSVRFRDAQNGIATGGDFNVVNGSLHTSAWSEDGGETWTASEVFPGGYRSGSSWAPGLCGVAVAVGPSGSDITLDAGKTWVTFDRGSFDAVECVYGRVCWASGSAGRVGKLSLR